MDGDGIFQKNHHRTIQTDGSISLNQLKNTHMILSRGWETLSSSLAPNLTSYTPVTMASFRHCLPCTKVNQKKDVNSSLTH